MPRKMSDIFKTTSWNAFSLMEMYEFWLKIHWSLFPRVQSTILQHWFRWWLGADQATSHYLNQCWLVYRRIYSSLSVNELRLYSQSRWLSYARRRRKTRPHMYATHENWTLESKLVFYEQKFEILFFIGNKHDTEFTRKLKMYIIVI